MLTLKEAREQGSHIYYTGLACIHGHIAYRYVKTRQCSDCAKIKQQAYAAKNAVRLALKSSATWAGKTKEEREEHNILRKIYYNNTRVARLAEKKKAYEKLRLNEQWMQEKRDKTNTYRALHGRIDKQHPLSKKKWKLENKGSVNAAHMKRHVSKINRTPVWTSETDIWMMKEIYELCELRTRLTGISWHVDHIIPLQGVCVSGLHTPYNLQVIPAMENIKKGNKFEVLA